MFKLIKIVLSGIAVLVIISAVATTLFLNLSPQFGGSTTPEQRSRYEITGHYKDGKFFNLDPFNMEVDCHGLMAMIEKMLNPPELQRPSRNIEVNKISSNTLQEGTVIWLGHSAFLIRLDGRNILLDPIFSQHAAPHPWLGQRRYHREMPIKIEDLPPIDFVIVSHDHYDHLDYDSIKKLASKTKRFLTPLGVGNHLRRWEIEEDRITELDWWEESQHESILIALTPSLHMSGRALTDQSSTLWGSWVIKGREKSIYFSGDSGYGSHFKKVGEKYGPFDIGLMESGQYDELWADVHMMPEQTVQAAMEAKAKLILPIHWAAFTLANHTWIDPVVRVTAAARLRGQAITTPAIGEPVYLAKPAYPTGRWWEQY